MEEGLQEMLDYEKRLLGIGILASVVVGVGITLISGLVQTPMAHLGVAVVYWGIPLHWTIRVIPTRIQSIDWTNLIADLAFWVIIASTASTSLMYFARKRGITSQASLPRVK